MGGSHGGKKFQQRYQQATRFIVPQLRQSGRPLNQLRALEIGCGEGPKLCALAPLFDRYVGIDLDAHALELGRENARALNITNADIRLQAADDLPEVLAAEQFDVIFLYAVLEHLTVAERLATLRLCWDMLPENGLLYFGEAPNRIAPIDYHSTKLPYFHMMPPELAQEFIDRSAHESWRTRVRSEETVELGLYRNGQHVGFEEFDLAIAPPDQLAQHLLLDNWSEPMMNLYPLRWFEPRNLDDFAQLTATGVHQAPLPPLFARYWLEGILVKNSGTPPPPVRFPKLSGPQETRAFRDPVGTAFYGLRQTETASFTLDAPATELMLGVTQKSYGQISVAQEGKDICILEVEDIQSANAGSWAPQSWRRIALPANRAGQTLTISAAKNAWIGLCPPFIR